ncbi:MAG: hypothetical protein AVDCRST_MAG77-3726 [uncultured Chloroflexi bacterium]|uniref:Protein-glutamine gamma-glutamyltransferase-like C-terminal domain-containing protein n=1 Tax=uncultured Chloroflexota bacterium TaxID=166587 RepID=A0A6J4J2K0_9CHLR|nr:MAG: hypothetical protein AVDCRST_MAG77-3726 [uncultured Chloroflexota bacterium]
MNIPIWSQNVQRFLALAMFACVSWAFGEMLVSFGARPARAISTALLALLVFSAGVLLGGRQAGRHYRRYTDYSVVDWALLLVPLILLLKLLPTLLENPASAVAEVASWAAEPWRFWDVALVWSLLLVFLVWDYSVRIAEQLGFLTFQPGEVPSGAAGGAAGASTNIAPLPAEIAQVYPWSRPAASAGGVTTDTPAADATDGAEEDAEDAAPTPSPRRRSYDQSPFRFASHAVAWRKLMWSFLNGGFAVLIFAGLSLVSVDDLGNSNRPEVGGVIPSVLLYYVLGLVLASQTSLDRLRADWLRTGATVQVGLSRRWLSYGLALMLAALVVAVLLPTSFTDRAADQLPGAWGALWLVTWPFRFVLGGVFGAIGWVFAHIAAFLFAPIAGLLPQGTADVAPGQTLARPTPAPADPVQDAFPSLLSRLVFGFLLYVLPLAVAAYAIWNTWRKRREVWHGLRATGRDVWELVRGAMLDLLALLWRFFGVVSPSFLERAPAAIRERLRRRAAATRGAASSSWLRLRNLGPRELIQYFYVSLVQRAASLGWERRRGQTAYEYSRDLADRLPDRRSEVTALTDAFVHAKYSRRTVAQEDAQRARRPWERLRGELQTRRRASRVAGWFGLGRQS